MTPGSDAVGSSSEAQIAPVARLEQHSIDLVRRSMRRFRGEERHVAERFYHHLFELAPEVRRLFPADMGDQHLRLFDTLLLTVDGLDDPDDMETRLLALGGDHFRRGVEEQHLQYVAHALVRAVRDLQPDDWSSLLSSAWIALYSWMIGHMVIGHRAARLRTAGGSTQALT